jgi:hypothetical protein
MKKNTNHNFQQLKYFISNNITNFKPWEIISGERSNVKQQGLYERFPKANLYPFAVRTDCDDVACFDLNSIERVVVIHDYSSVGWEKREIFDTFWDWFRSAIDDMIEFAKDDIEYEQKNLD